MMTYIEDILISTQIFNPVLWIDRDTAHWFQNLSKFVKEENTIVPPHLPETGVREPVFHVF